MVSEEIRLLLEQCASSFGAHVVDLQFRGEDGTRIIEAFVDSEQGVTTDLCSRISSKAVAAMDATSALAYRLVVSSPGASRSLLFPWQYRKHIGRTLEVQQAEAGESLQGKLLAVDDQGIILRSKHGEIAVPFPSVRDAHVLLPW